MIQQNVLDLTPSVDLFAHLAKPGAANGEVDFRATGTFRGLRRRRIPHLASLEAVETWTLEPYRGSEFEILPQAPGPGVRRKRILFQRHLPEILRGELSRRDPEQLSIRLGDPFEAYPSAEQRLRITRSLLEALETSRGHQIDLTTRSPLVLRDQDLLRRLDLKHSVTVRVPIATLDASLAARFEPGTATPASRLAIVRALARDGISVVISCQPVLPGINSSADELVPLFEAIRRAGALDVLSDMPLTASRDRRRVGAWLDRNFPEQKAKVLGRLGPSRSSYLGTLERLRLSFGFPVHSAGRG